MNRVAPQRAPGFHRTGSLRRALGARAAGVWAFVGAGGKSAAIQRWMLEDPIVLATTTTHLALHGFGGVLVAARDVAGLDEALPHFASVRPLTVALRRGDRLAAPSATWLAWWLASQSASRVLVEADGAARRLAKLPAPHEPAWPPVPDVHVVLVVGLRALGEAADEVLHRPAAFRRAGIAGSEVRVAHLDRMIADYVALAPPRAPLVLLLTGAGDADERVVRRLGRSFGRCVRQRDAGLQSPAVPWRVVATPDVTTGPYWTWRDAGAASPRVPRLPGVCGVLLAAGRGSRFGSGASKLLARWRGKTLIEHAVSTWCRAGFARLVVVTGADADRIEPLIHAVAAARGVHVRVVRNPRFARGLGTSVRAAARAAPEGFGLLVGHADMPAIGPATLRRLADLGSTLRRSIVVPWVGRAANPVYFAADLRRPLARVPDARGGKAVFERHRDRIVYVPMSESAEFVDVDRAQDLRRLPRPGGRR